MYIQEIGRSVSVAVTTLQKIIYLT